jgi:hypothetical protein
VFLLFRGLKAHARSLHASEPLSRSTWTRARALLSDWSPSEGKDIPAFPGVHKHCSDPDPDPDLSPDCQLEELRRNREAHRLGVDLHAADLPNRAPCNQKSQKPIAKLYTLHFTSHFKMPMEERVLTYITWN